MPAGPDRRSRQPTSGPVAFRPAAADDAVRLAALCGELGYPSSEEEMRIRFNQIATDPMQAVQVAMAGGEVVAWIHVARVRSLEAGEHAEIRGLVVDENWRAQGIGGGLVAWAQRWTAAARDCRRLRVRSNAVRVRAHRFYEALGFETVKTQHVFEKDCGRP